MSRTVDVGFGGKIALFSPFVTSFAACAPCVNAALMLMPRVSPMGLVPPQRFIIGEGRQTSMLHCRIMQSCRLARHGAAT